MSDTPKKRRPKGDGSLQKLAKDKYKIQVTVGYDQAGKQLRRSFTAKTKGEAIAMLNSYKGDFRRCSLPASAKITFAAYAARWLMLKKHSTKIKSFYTYEQAMQKHLLPSFGHLRLDRLTTAKINDYFAAKAAHGLSVATLRQHRSILHNVLNLAIAEEMLNQNPAGKAAPLPQFRHTYNILTQAEIKKLLVAAREYQTHATKPLKCLYHLILLALATGLRRGELLALSWNNVDMAASTIAVKENLVEVAGKQLVDTPKTNNSQRVVAVEPKVLGVIRQELWADDSGPVFRTAAGRHIPFTTLGRLFRQLIAKAEIKKAIRLHDLRHTHVSHLLAEGYDFKMISNRIGDDVRTAMTIYAHALPEKDRSAACFIGDKLFD